MKKTILLTAVLGCSALWAGAQTTTMPNPQNGADQPAASSGQSSAGQMTPSTSAANSVTVDGCLAGSGSSYTLKDKTSGVTYQLVGDTAKLAPHVGHELQLTEDNPKRARSLFLIGRAGPGQRPSGVCECRQLSSPKTQNYGDPYEKDDFVNSSSWLFRPLGWGTNHHDA